MAAHLGKETNCTSMVNSTMAGEKPKEEVQGIAENEGTDPGACEYCSMPARVPYQIVTIAKEGRVIIMEDAVLKIQAEGQERSSPRSKRRMRGQSVQVVNLKALIHLRLNSLVLWRMKKG